MKSLFKLYVLQIQGDFEYLYATESPRFTSKWETVASIVLDRTADCKDPTTVGALALFHENGDDRMKSISGRYMYIQI